MQKEQWNPYAYYETPGVRETCHDLKQDADTSKRRQAATRVAEAMSEYVDIHSVLIPAPSHTGRATYTLEIAKLISKRSGAIVADILRCIPHEPLYDQKLEGKYPEIHMYTDGNIPDSMSLYFVDNVIETGTTLREAEHAIGRKLIPLIYAVSKEGRRGRKQ